MPSPVLIVGVRREREDSSRQPPVQMMTAFAGDGVDLSGADQLEGGHATCSLPSSIRSLKSRTIHRNE